MPSVLYVSKPVAPPWNDSSKNLVRDLALGLTRYSPAVMTRRGEDHSLGSTVEADPIYPASAGGFAPGMKDNARVMGRLLIGRAPDLVHFFFAPNPKSSAAGRLATTLRRMPSVHTICSAPREEQAAARVLFADKNVVLSAHTEARMLAAGVPRERLVRIPPAIAPLTPPSAAAVASGRALFDLPATAPLLCYPGDLEFGRGALTVLEAFAAMPQRDALLVMACRAKTAGAREAEQQLRAQAEQLGVAPRVVWIGETNAIHTLLAAVDVVLLPTDTLYAKMDYPLVILEAMSLGKPVVVGLGTPAEELCTGGAALATEVSRDAVLDVMTRLTDSAALRADHGERGRQRVLSAYTRAPMAAAYEAVYDELRA